MNKVGIELSVNFLVTFILTIVVLGFGIRIATGIFDEGEKLSNQAIEDLDRNLEKLFCQGDSVVCLGKNTKVMKQKAFHKFTLHVINVLGEDHDFTYTITRSAAFAPDQTPLAQNILEFLPEDRTVTLRNTEEGSFGIGVQVPGGAPKGTYTLSVRVEDENQDVYGGIQRIYVTVK